MKLTVFRIVFPVVILRDSKKREKIKVANWSEDGALGHSYVNLRRGET